MKRSLFLIQNYKCLLGIHMGLEGYVMEAIKELKGRCKGNKDYYKEYRNING